MYKLRLLEVNYNYYKKRGVTEDTYNSILSLDPTDSKKYSAWLLNVYLKNSENFYDQKDEFDERMSITNALFYFDSFKEKNIIPALDKDINSFVDVEDICEYMVANIDEFNKQLKIKMTKKGKDAVEIYRDSEHLVVIPLSHEAARKYGTGTSWCTAVSSCYHYDHYKDEGKLYIHRFLDEEGAFTGEAYQLFLPTNKTGRSKIELKDESNDAPDNLKDSFYQGLPKEIVNEFEDKIEKLGGYNKRRTIRGEMETNIVHSTGLIRGEINYYLYEETDDSLEVIDTGVDTHCEFAVELLKPNKEPVSLSERDNNIFYYFNKNNGYGLFVHQGDNTPREVYKHAVDQWVDQVEEHPDTDGIENYNFYEDLRNLIGDTQIDYIIYDHSYIDQFFTDQMYKYLDIDEEGVERYTDFIEVPFVVTHRSEYDKEPDNTWTSDKYQRKRDRQKDLEFD